MEIIYPSPTSITVTFDILDATVRAHHQRVERIAQAIKARQSSIPSDAEAQYIKLSAQAVAKAHQQYLQTAQPPAKSHTDRLDAALKRTYNANEALRLALLNHK